MSVAVPNLQGLAEERGPVRTLKKVVFWTHLYKVRKGPPFCFNDPAQELLCVRGRAEPAGSCRREGPLTNFEK